MDPFQSAESIPTGPQRPTFLTVLCILTFIASGWGIFSNISNYMNAAVNAKVAETLLDSTKEKISKEADSEGTSKLAEQVFSGASKLIDPASIKKNALFSILANLLTLVGAFLMFQLKKQGFWVYLAGTAISIITPIIVYGASNILSIGMTAGIGFFGILFVVLYSLNLKYLR